MDTLIYEDGNNHTDNCTTVSQGDKNTLLYVSGSVAIFSGLYCLLALAAVIIKRLYKKPIYRLAMYQVTVALLQSFTLALGLMLIDYNEEELYYQVSCKATAFMGQFFIVVNLFFISWLTFHLFVFAVFFKDLKRLEWLYISSSVLIPLLVACIPFITDSYGVAGAWCYIRSLKQEGNCTTKPDVIGITEQFSLYYGPAAVLFTINVMAIVAVTVTMVCRMWTYKPQLRVNNFELQEQLLSVKGYNQNAKALKQILPLFAYPIIYFVLFLAAFSNRLYIATQGATSFSFSVAHAATQSLKGFFVGLALIIHVVVTVKRGRRRRRSARAKTDQHNITYDGATPYTSGAVTSFPLPKETDVDDRF